MKLQKIFSSHNGENLYSVLMTEDEYRLFSKSNSRKKEAAIGAGLTGAGVASLKVGLGEKAKDKIVEKGLKQMESNLIENKAVDKKLKEYARKQGIKVVESEGQQNAAYLGSGEAKVARKVLAKFIKKARKSDPKAAKQIVEGLKNQAEYGIGIDGDKFLHNMGKDAVLVGKDGKGMGSPAVLAHELGHASYSNGRKANIVGKAAHKTMTAGKLANKGSGAVGFYQGYKASQEDGKHKDIKRLGKSLGYTAATAAPILIGEAAASRKGIKLLKKSGASKEMVKSSQKALKGAWNTYAGEHLAHQGVNSVGGYAAGRGVGMIKGKKKKDQD